MASTDSPKHAGYFWPAEFFSDLCHIQAAFGPAMGEARKLILCGRFFPHGYFDWLTA